MLALAIAVAIASVALGAALGLVGRGVEAAVGPVRTFAVVSAVVVVLVQLLPEAAAELGVSALGVFLVALALPSIVGQLGRFALLRARGEQRSPSGLGLALGYWALAVHKLGDGLGLGAFAGEGHEGHHHLDLFLAISAHTVPMTALVVLAYRSREGTRGALLRAAGLAAAIVSGVLLAGSVPESRIAPFEPWIAAIVAGLLVHVVAHDFQPGVTATTRSRLLDLAAVAAGLALALLGDGAHEHGAGGGLDVRWRTLEAFRDLTLIIAPTLLAGLLLAALLQSFGGSRPLALGGGRSGLAQALRGSVLGAPMPICTCGVLPWAESLRSRGARTALVVAFLLATPELGLETLALTVRLLGWPFAIVRVGAALGLAVLAAVAVAFVARSKEHSEQAHEIPALDEGAHLGWPRLVWDHFEELLYHVAPFTLIGLVAAAYADSVLPEGAFTSAATSGLDVIGIAAVAVPSYVCAASATPLAFVLVLKGMSPGAALAGMLLGPVTNAATVRFLGRSFGVPSTLVALGTLTASTLALAYGVNAVGLPTDAVGIALDEARHSTLAWGSASVLAMLVARSIWRDGVQGWLGSLGASLSADEHGHAHGHVHAHGHGHG